MARAVPPMSTCGRAGREVPVTVTRVPPVTDTVFGLSEVIPNAPIEG